MLELASEESGQRPLQASELAKRQQLPRKFLEAILLELTRHGLIQSKLGRSGGYVLARKPGDITVGEIIRVLEGPLALIPCVSKTAYRRCDECLDEETCGVQAGDEGSPRRHRPYPRQHHAGGAERPVARRRRSTPTAALDMKLLVNV